MAMQGEQGASEKFHEPAATAAILPFPIPPASAARPKGPHPGAGHRDRLRRRLIDAGPQALSDHELIECLLALAIPRIDTKPLAKRLIERFGGLGPLLAADPEAIRRAGASPLSDRSVAAIKIVQAAALRLVKTRIDPKRMLGSWTALIDYLHADMAHESIERVRALFLNARNELIRDEVLWEGSVDESAVHVRELMRRAMDLGATALIIVHNHPSGDPTPSQQDIRLTREIVEAGRHLKIVVHDHVIIGAKGHSSLRNLGLV
jgi:DNA repair protein RadC